MNKLFYLTVFLTFSFFANAQSLKELDAKHGFKEFTLGDDLSKWQSDLIYNRTWDDNGISYVYIGSLGRKVFDFDIKDIELKFFQNKLVEIYLTTKPFQPSYALTGVYPKNGIDIFKNLISQFENLFGNGFAFTASASDKADFKTIWAGKTTSLIVQHDYLGFEYGSRAYIILKNNEFSVKSLKNGF